MSGFGKDFFVKNIVSEKFPFIIVFMEFLISSFIDMFTTRDFAIITWGIAFLLYFLINKNTRSRTQSVLKSTILKMNNKLFVILSGYFVVLTVLFYFLGTKFGDWETYMVKDAALWFLFSGLPLNVKYIKEKEYFGQLKDTVLENFKVALLFDCVFSTYTFGYIAELFLVMAIIALCYTLLFTEDKEEHRKVNSATKGILMMSGTAVVFYVIYATCVHHSEVFSKLIITELTQPFYYTCFFILSAIVLKTLAKEKEGLFVTSNANLEVIDGKKSNVIHIDPHFERSLTMVSDKIEKFDIIHLFFEKNKYAVKKIYKRTFNL